MTDTELRSMIEGKLEDMVSRVEYRMPSICRFPRAELFLMAGELADAIDRAGYVRLPAERNLTHDLP